MSDELRIYVACLASYNNGVLHGAWIDCEGKDADELRTSVAAMLRSSQYPNVMRRDWSDGFETGTVTLPVALPEGAEWASEPYRSAEEWAIHDHEGFGSLIGESTSFDDVAMIAEALAGDDTLAFQWLIVDRGMNAAEAADRASDVSIWNDDRGQSEDSMLGNYAESFMDDTGGLEGVPDHLRNYIDFEAMGRDFRLGGDIDLAEINDTRFIVTNASEF